MHSNNPSITINSIIFKNGFNLKLNNDDIVILVGGNNVGKSRTLKDIRNDIIGESKNKVLIDTINYLEKNFTETAIRKYLENNYKKDNSGNYSIYTDNFHSYGFNESNFNNFNNKKSSFYKLLYSFLSTENRLEISLGMSEERGINQSIVNIIEHFSSNKEDLIILNKYLYSAFKKCVNVENDYLNLLFKIGDKNNVDRSIASSYHEAKNYIQKLEKLSEQGDGIRSAVSIISYLIAQKHKLFLIDEPETFLHPPQARMLGKFIFDLSKNKQLFISTHDIDFLKGIVESNSNRIKVIKINRRGNSNEYHLLDNNEFVKMCNNRQLKYSNILNGLFYEKVLLCEDESDCKFYSNILQTINVDKYLNTMLCGVGGKNNFKKIIPILEKININYSVISDIDLINDIQTVKDILNSNIENNYKEIEMCHKNFLRLFENEKFNQIRKKSEIKKEICKLLNNDNNYITNEIAEKIKKLLVKTNNYSVLKKEGISCIKNKECLLEYKKLKEYLITNNIYILDYGEIENFFNDCTGHGEKYVDMVFNKHPNLNSKIYNNVRKFIKEIIK